MKKTVSAYEGFARLVLEGSSCRDYLRICKSLHVHPDDLDEILYSELGCTGDEILSEFHKLPRAAQIDGIC